MGLYFEIYGLAPGEAVGFRVGSEKLSASMLEGFAWNLHLSSRDPAMEVAWSEPGGESDTVTPRFFRFDLVNLGEREPGHYGACLPP